MKTVREYLIRRTRTMKAIVYVGCGALLAFVVLRGVLSRLQISCIGFGGGLAVALIAIVATKLIFPFACRQCGKGLGRLPSRERAKEVTRALMSAEGMGSCPHCGASFDVPLLS